MNENPVVRVEPARVVSVCKDWLSNRIKLSGLDWLTEKEKLLKDGAADWVFYTSFSSVPRYLGKADLGLSDGELQVAVRVRPGWDPRLWSVDQIGRLLLMLSLPTDQANEFVRKLETVLSAADVRESIVFYQSLPLLPHPERFVLRAVDGLRSSMSSVFEAVALRNPFPAEWFDESQWNQMVLKAVFVGSRLADVQQLDRRANARLARMLVDFYHERRAASRPVTPEIWRLIGPFLRESDLVDLRQVLDNGLPREREAAALALASSDSYDVSSILNQYPDLETGIRSGKLTWNSVSTQI